MKAIDDLKKMSSREPEWHKAVDEVPDKTFDEFWASNTLAIPEEIARQIWKEGFEAGGEFERYMRDG